MRTLRMVYGARRRRSLRELIAMGMEIGEYLQEHTEETTLTRRQGISGRGPGSRSIRISYDIEATADYNLHTIEIDDPSPPEEERLERGLRKIYERNHFFPAQD